MAVANSTTQITMPGLDAAIQSNLNTALNTNTTLQSVLASVGNIPLKVVKPVTVKLDSTQYWTRPANSLGSVEVILVGGGGGGKGDIATAGGKNPAALDEALELARDKTRAVIGSIA